jgi:hypothetical protein
MISIPQQKHVSIPKVPGRMSINATSASALACASNSDPSADVLRILIPRVASQPP